MPLSYAGKAYALLERYNVEDYDLVKIITEKGEIVGRIMPRPSIFDDEHVIIKLPNGYNIGVNIGKISEIKVLEKAYQREEAIPEVEFRENLPYIPFIVTGGTISSRVDYRTGAVRAYEKPEELLDLIPVELEKFIEWIDGELIVPGNTLIHGYTVIDSIRAIENLSGTDFMKLFGSSTERALIFTRVGTGRSPMVALKVFDIRPSLVVLHGLKPDSVDRLGIRLAEIMGVPLAVSKMESVRDMVESLRKRLE